MSQKLADRILKKVAEGRTYFHSHTVLNSGRDSLLLQTDREAYTNPSNVNLDDLLLIAKHASEIIDKDLFDYNTLSGKHAAAEMAIKTLGEGKYDGKIDSVNFFKIVNLMNSKTGGTMKRTANYYTAKLDSIADEVRKLVKAQVITPKQGFALEMSLDKISDELETHGVTAHVLESDAEEAYVRDAFKDNGTIEHDADEPYVSEMNNKGQGEMSNALADGRLKETVKEGSAKLDAQKLAAKRQK
jgi:hypothetical protein